MGKGEGLMMGEGLRVGKRGMVKGWKRGGVKGGKG